jgi:hypothetical protein
MRFLVDANMPRSTLALLAGLGHTGEHARDIKGLIVLRMPDDAVAQTIVNLLERFLKQTELATRLPGHLVIIEPDRVRFRPALQ